jgi:hypothetical protein
MEVLECHSHPPNRDKKGAWEDSLWGDVLQCEPMPDACEPRDGQQHENGRLKVSFSPISGDVSCSSFLSMQSHLSGFSTVTSMNRRNCVKCFTENYWENLVWNLAGGIIAWVNQLIVLSSLHKSKQEMSSGRICSLLKLSLTVFSMYQHGVSTNSRGALERERVRPNGFCFPAAGQKECSSYCLPIQFC